MNYLSGTISIGDFKPTDQHREVFGLLKDRMNAAVASYNNWKLGDLATLKSILEENNIGVFGRVEE